MAQERAEDGRYLPSRCPYCGGGNCYHHELDKDNPNESAYWRWL